MSWGIDLHPRDPDPCRRVERPLAPSAQIVQDAFDMLAGAQPVGGEITAAARILKGAERADFNLVGAAADRANAEGAEITSLWRKRLYVDDFRSAAPAAALQLVRIGC